MKASRRYEIFDVFTSDVLAGNPLAIVHDADDLDEVAMQAIAREFNLSETVFVRQSEKPGHSAAIRIFTPHYELPFAGHPTVGTAVALAYRRFPVVDSEAEALIVLEEKIGTVRCGVRLSPVSAFAEFDLPRLPDHLGVEIEKRDVATALGLSPHEVGFENHTPSVWSAGNPYLMVPVHDLAAAAKIEINAGFAEKALPSVGTRRMPVYAYCRESVYHDSAFHARMFVISGGYEDPATGSAVAAFAGTMAHFDEPLDGLHPFWIEQGIEMGRPSRIRLEIEIADLKIAAARIGGAAVKVAEGTLFT
ncbi:MAG: PhzF family phenazine biosynthesis protein [Phyllobacterium sp.]